MKHSLYDVQLEIANYLKTNGVPVNANSNDTSARSVSIDVSLDLGVSDYENWKLFDMQRRYDGDVLTEKIRTPFVLSLLLQSGKNTNEQKDKGSIESLLKEVYFLLVRFERQIKDNKYQITLQEETLQVRWDYNGILKDKNVYQTSIHINIGGRAYYE